MSKRQLNKVIQTTEVAPRLRKALAKRTKEELLDTLVELAEEDRGVFRRLAARFELEGSAHELAAATRQAIADATDFDERDSNRNFSYDYEAYGEVKRNLSRLIKLKELHLAMELSLELMKQGSRQVEMSDEGLMTHDIEECLRVVLSAVKKSGYTPEEVVTWCVAMASSDRVGSICDRELAKLRKSFEVPKLAMTRRHAELAPVHRSRHAHGHLIALPPRPPAAFKEITRLPEGHILFGGGARATPTTPSGSWSAPTA